MPGLTPLHARRFVDAQACHHGLVAARMDYSRSRSDPRRHLVGIAVVVLLHVGVAYALVTGLAKKVVDVVRAPVETQVIEEIKKPPPPELVLPPTPRLEAPAPSFIPPPEVRVATPSPVQNTITVTTSTPPPAPAPVVIAPVAPPVAAPTIVAARPPPIAPPAPVSAAVVCSNYTTVMGDAGYPREAVRAGLGKGEALVQFTLGANGSIRDVKVIRASDPIFARNSARIVAQYECQGQGRDLFVQVPFSYKLDNWGGSPARRAQRNTSTESCCGSAPCASRCPAAAHAHPDDRGTP